MATLGVLAVTGAGVVTGLLFAFSNFVMRALADLPNEYGMFAMQRVNETIINPIFLALFFGTPVFCFLIAIRAFQYLDASGSLFLLIGAVAYLIGPFGITMFFNVPLNNKLARAEASVADEVWPDYQKRWQTWNHIRTYIGVASIAMLAAGLGAGEG